MKAADEPSRTRRRAPRLRTLMLQLSLANLLVPLFGILVLRLYESALVRRAESELIAQGALLAAAYREEVLRLAPHGLEGYGRPLPPALRARPGEPLKPVVARLDLALDPILPRPPDAFPPRDPPDFLAREAGARLSAAMQEAQRLTLAGMRIVDRNGTVVGTTRGELGLSLANRDEVVGAIHGELVRLLRARDSDEPPPPLESLSRSARVRVFLAMPVIHGERVWGAVVLSRTPMGIGQSLYGVRWPLLSGVALVLLLIAAISALTSWTVTRPVDELIQQTERVARGEREAARPLRSPGTHEVGQLSEAFARMALALEQRASYIGSFASSVSHEFKTPLAAMHGTVELLRDHLAEMTEAERTRFLDNLEADVARLDTLVSGLLELARADTEKPGAASCGLAETLEPLLEAFAARGQAPVVSAGAPGARVQVPRAALETIVTNLLDNAFRHGGAGARVGLETRARVRDGVDGIELVVRDTGPGISEANRKRIFEAFFTTARAQGGTGLGLAIVRSLVEAHRGSIDLGSRPGATEFRVWLPGEPSAPRRTEFP